jgi:hypothetical protein
LLFSLDADRARAGGADRLTSAGRQNGDGDQAQKLFVLHFADFPIVRFAFTIDF